MKLNRAAIWIVAALSAAAPASAQVGADLVAEAGTPAGTFCSAHACWHDDHPRCARCRRLPTGDRAAAGAGDSISASRVGGRAPPLTRGSAVRATPGLRPGGNRGVSPDASGVNDTFEPAPRKASGSARKIRGTPCLSLNCALSDLEWHPRFLCRGAPRRLAR